jgi:hypothetical protein
MGSTFIDNLLNRHSVGERTDWAHLNSSPEKQAPHTDIEHQISAMMLRYEQLLGIVASCKCCSGKYRQKIGANRMTTGFSDHNAYQDTNT